MSFMTLRLDRHVSVHYISILMLRFVLLFFATGCAATPVNPSFPITAAQARQAIEQMRADPRPLHRPVVLIGGFLDPNIAPIIYRYFFASVTINAKLIPVSIGFCNSFAECRQKVVAAVDSACPSADPVWTTEVDVVGASLGGLVARFAAAPSPDAAHPRRLRIARLFSISSPHSGSELAESFAITDFHREIRPHSAFLNQLASEDSQARYVLYPYVLLNDTIIDDRYATPPGQTPFWLANNSLLPAHDAAMFDGRILADIARRLRDQPAFSRYPAAPLPRADQSVVIR
jgi:hypothetical protein